MKDPYVVLGVNRTATLEEIKKSYREKARLYHPDKNKDDPKAPEMFKEINEAYEILKDKKKRAAFDRQGFSFFSNAEEINPDDIAGGLFREVFNNFRKNGGFSEPMRTIVTVDLSVTLEELYTGTMKKLKIKRKTATQNKPKEQVLEVNILPGYKDGTRITFPNEGDDNSDLVFIVRQLPHERFVRNGANLLSKLRISLLDALVPNNEIFFTHLNGQKIGLNKYFLQPASSSSNNNNNNNAPIRKTIKPNQKLVLREMGMPRFGGMDQLLNKAPFGDLLIEIEIVFPEKLTREQMDLITKALGGGVEEAKL